MKRNVLFMVALFFVIACQPSKDDFIAKLVEKNNAYKSVHFKAMEKYYYSNGIDTIVTPYEAWVVKDETDSLHGGYVWIDNNYRPYNIIYEQGNFYLAIPPKKTTVLYENYDEYFISPVDWIDEFLVTDNLKKMLTDSLNKIAVSDTVYEGENCKVLSVEFPENAKGEKQTNIYFINTDFVPLYAEMQLKTADYTYYDKLYFSDYTFNNVKISDLKERKKQVLTENPVEKSGNSETAHMESMLHIGDAAPLFDGLYYGTQENFKLADYIGKNVVIVDFWYTHCPPCVRAMPALSALYDDYIDKGLKIFGLNSVDNSPHSLPGLDKFLAKRKLSYPVIMIQPTVDLMYKIKGYPTMYVVDKSGKIAYVEIGFNKTKFEELKTKIDELLSE